MDCLSPSRWLGLAIVALTLPGCFTTTSDDDDSTPKTDGSDDTSCFSEFTLEFPDGTTTSPDYCQAYTMKAQFEFDPDEPPEIRTTELQFHAVTEDDFECWIQLLEPDACGTGYYRLDAADGVVSFDTHDCTGVPDDYEGQYSSASGYIRFDQLDAGDEPGNFSGEPLETTVSGYLSVATDDDILLSGDFSMTKDVKGSDTEEVDCAVSDGDDDDDGFIAADLGGDDCDDEDPDTYPGAAESEGDDCMTDADDDGYGSTTPADGVTAGSDCDDADHELNPDTEDTVGDDLDQNCDDVDGTDSDGDGEASEESGGEDCDDDEVTIHTDAYERPDDDIDQDCDGEDRQFDGVVLDEGESVDENVELELGSGPLDVALVLDTTCSMSSWLSALDVDEIIDAVTAELSDTQYGFATYDDYAYGSYGSEGTDLPFELHHQMTDEPDDVQDAIDDTSLHSGADAPESSMEALYQALTGDGYDQGCDGSYDEGYDVLPFVADSEDAFEGAETGTYDSSVSGTGMGGGMGFRESGTPVVVYITDNYLRDPDAEYGTPGGCLQDAGASDVVAAAEDMGAWIVGIDVGSGYAIEQIEEMASDLGMYVDTDGDGEGDSLPVYSTTDSTELNTTIAGALDEISSVAGTGGTYEEVSLEVSEDEYGLVESIDPESYEDVDSSETDSLEFVVTLSGELAAGEEVATTVISLDLVGDGSVIGSTELSVEVPPSYQ